MPRRDLCSIPRRSPATGADMRRVDRTLEGEEPADLPVQAPAPERRMRWSFRLLREEYLRGSYVCQVESSASHPF